MVSSSIRFQVGGGRAAKRKMGDDVYAFVAEDFRHPVVGIGMGQIYPPMWQTALEAERWPRRDPHDTGSGRHLEKTLGQSGSEEGSEARDRYTVRIVV